MKSMFENPFEAEVRSALEHAKNDGKNVIYQSLPVWHVSPENVGLIAISKDRESRYIKTEGVFVTLIKGFVMVTVLTSVTESHMSALRIINPNLDAAFNNVDDVLIASTYRPNEDVTLKADILVARPHSEATRYMMQPVGSQPIEPSEVEGLKIMSEQMCSFLSMVIDTKVAPTYAFHLGASND